MKMLQTLPLIGLAQTTSMKSIGYYALDFLLERGESCTIVPWLINHSEILQAADAIVSGQDEFKQKLQSFLNKRAGGKLPTTKEELDQHITNYELEFCSSKDQAMGALSDANGAQQSYRTVRQSGVKRVGRVTQEFVKTFADFLGVYSGIISLMRGAGSVYGEVAYEVLSVFFIVGQPTFLEFLKY